MTTTTIKPKFDCGVLLATPGGSEAFERMVRRHSSSCEGTSVAIGAKTVPRGPFVERPELDRWLSSSLGLQTQGRDQDLG